MTEKNQNRWQTAKFYRGNKVSCKQNTLYLIEQGLVRVSTCHLDRRIVLGYWGKNDVIGKPIMYFDFYEIECLATVVLAIVPDNDWYYLAKEIRRCFQDLEKTIYVLSQRSVEEKLLELLIYFGDKFGSNCDRGKEIILPLTHLDFAQYLNTTRVSITRSFQQLQIKKYIEIPKRGKIILHLSQISKI